MSEPRNPWLPPEEQMPRWVWKAIAIFWLGFIVTIVPVRCWFSLSTLLVLLLVSLFLSLAVEPGVNRLAAPRLAPRHGDDPDPARCVLRLPDLRRRDRHARRSADRRHCCSDSEKYVTRTVDFINDIFDTNIDATQVIDEINDPDGPVQEFIRSQQGQGRRPVDRPRSACSCKAFSVLLFTFYLVADGPRLRRAICSRFAADAAGAGCCSAWELAIDKTGGYLYSRALLAGLSAFFHWVLFQAIGIQAPVAMALWVGLISQFLPVVGTYIAGALPVLVQFVDSPPKALIVLVFVVLYQQVENYFLLPRVTARTMELHPAVAFGAALAGAAVLGAVGAILAHPGCGHGPGCHQRLRRAARSDRQPPHQHARPSDTCPAENARVTDTERQRWRTLTAFVPIAVTRRSGLRRVGALRRTSSGSRPTARSSSSIGDPDRARSTHARRTSRCRQWRWSRNGLRLPPELLALGLRQPQRHARHVEARTADPGDGRPRRAVARQHAADLPLDRATAEEVLRTGGGRTPLQMNCSGKHGGMLVTSAINGWPVDASTWNVSIRSNCR